MTYGRKLLLYSVGLTVFIIISIFFTSQNLVNGLLIKHQLEYEANSSIQAGQYMSTLFDNVDTWIKVLQNNQDIIDNMTVEYDDDNFREINRVIKTVDARIGSVIADTQYIDKLIMIGENDLVYVRDFILTGGYYLGDSFNFARFLEIDQINPLLENSIRPFYYKPANASLPAGSGEEQLIEKISNKILYTDFIKGDNNDIKAMIIISFKDDMASKLFSYAREPRSYYLTDQEQTVIWSSREGDRSLPQPDLGSPDKAVSHEIFTADGTKHLVTRHHLAPHSFYLYKQLPMDYILKEVPVIHRYALITGSGCLLVVIILSILLSRKYAEPLTEMVNNFHKDPAGRFAPIQVTTKIPLPKLTISKKIVVFFIVAVGIPNFLFIGSVILSSYRVYENKIMELTKSTLSQVRWNLEYKMESYDNISKRLIYMDVVQRMLRGDTDGNIGNEQEQLESALVSVKLAKRDILSMGFFYPRGEALVVNDYFGSALDSSVDKHIISRISRGKDQLVLISGTGTGAGSIPVISFGRSIRSSSEGDFGNNIGFFILSIDRNELNNLLSNVHPDSRGDLFLLDEQGNRIASYGMGYPAFDIGELEKTEEGDYRRSGTIIFKESLTGYGLTLVETLPAYKLTSSLYPLLWYSTLLLLVYIIAIGVFTMAVASIIAKPITRLKIMLENLDENYHRNVEGYKGKDEIAILSMEYNKLISRLDDLIYENYQSRLRESELMFLEKEAQLNALQQQINPHFLYNTLESIKWMAYKKGDRKVCDMAAALGSFFRGAVSNKKELVTFGEELDHLENYIYIQKIRYNNKFSVQIDFEPSVKELLTVKLVLQPLVENSIIHGLEPVQSAGAILIEGKNGSGKVQITVKDNGAGMEPEELSTVRKRITGEVPEAVSTSVGLNNVYRRIQLYFSGQCSFEIDSRPGHGTTVTMEIPAIKDHS